MIFRCQDGNLGHYTALLNLWYQVLPFGELVLGWPEIELTLLALGRRGLLPCRRYPSSPAL